MNKQTERTFSAIEIDEADYKNYDSPDDYWKCEECGEHQNCRCGQEFSDDE